MVANSHYSFCSFCSGIHLDTTKSSSVDRCGAGMQTANSQLIQHTEEAY